MTDMMFSRGTNAGNPLDVIEGIVCANDWPFHRAGDQELAVQVPGRWCDYSLYFSWNEDMAAMHFTCAFEMRVPGDRRGVIYELLALINERTWLGHFGLWEDEGLPMFRYSMPLRGARGPSREQIEDVVDTAIDECERFYPAFQYVIWGGKAPGEAVTAAMIEPVGEA